MLNNFAKMLLALIIGLFGSIIFIYLHLPLPWLLGSIFATSLAIRFDFLPIKSPKLFSAPARILIGLAIGSAFTPEILQYIPQYSFSLLLVIPFTILVIFFGTYYYYKFLKYDLKTSYLGSMPGGVIEMVIIGEELKANTAKITLMQSSRLFFVVISLPFIIQYIFQIDIRGNQLLTTPLKNIDLFEFILLYFLATLSAFIAKRLKLTAAFLIGPMILAIVLYSSGSFSVAIPDEFLKFIQVVFGVIIGFTFKDVPLKTIYKTIIATFGHFILLAILCAIFIAIIFYFLDFKALDIMLSFSPGGQTEINLIALLVGANLPYITLHHIVRLIIVMNIAPIIAKKLN
ncbi:AbrB family transcriptional regulator [Aliarcobacter thereius]|uniref:Ammonia monooxygenase n=2 Tax=Aliarcobacter thereius TaxID=544718 RepID=A0A1C7WMU1_9BACT|nr:AbrB family transcriptional regulator [Aliarcobacter thereius]OCL92016.1 putative ammonia monooxygenase [Aliarcobacter thereius]OCL94888.1 putative ammonia monooxygenase [Aliarcobacter thereius LMG 24486]OCM00335.1 putative ammonia monooxygenase [Aliarcobacter thereius]QBF15238.1 putative ammonia monooxygenase [Aliarcobacter thereius LMG 24486]TLS91981.1 AbrB family transcriptional regulator [Aliarcobacter thereius]